MSFAMGYANFFTGGLSESMVRREAGGADRGSAAFWVSLVVVMPAAGGAIFGGDVDIEGFTLLSDDDVVNSVSVSMKVWARAGVRKDTLMDFGVARVLLVLCWIR